jgi:hypothetical protein
LLALAQTLDPQRHVGGGFLELALQPFQALEVVVHAQELVATEQPPASSLTAVAVAPVAEMAHRVVLPPTMRGSMTWCRRSLTALCAAGLALAACGGEEEPAASPEPASSSSTTTTPTTSMIAPPTPVPADQQDALIAAVVAYQRAQGVERIRFEVRNLLRSAVDPAWARFNASPSAGNEREFLGGIGVAHFDGAAWTVVDFGTDVVGCAPEVVPVAVQQSLQLACPIR